MAAGQVVNERELDNRGQPDPPIAKKRRVDDTIVHSRQKVARLGPNVSSSVGIGRDLSSHSPMAAHIVASKSDSNPSLVYSGINKQNPSSRVSMGSIAPPFEQGPKSDPKIPLSKEPKKGSYAEIMARAKANQAKPLAVGTISHKPKGKGARSYKQELKLQKQARRDKRLGIVRDQSGTRPSFAADVTRMAEGNRKGVRPIPTAPIKKPKPQPAYKGTMNPASMTAKAKEKATAQTTRRHNEYAGTDDNLDEEDEVEEDDGYGYDDDESDEMEAGFMDVEEEETAAARVARKEDEEEARLEAQLKREKEERKKKMEALAKKAKPQRY